MQKDMLTEISDEALESVSGGSIGGAVSGLIGGVAEVAGDLLDAGLRTIGGILGGLGKLIGGLGK